MNEQERKQALQELQQEERDRTLFQRVYGDEDGRQALAWLGNESGAWSTDPQMIKPELVAMFNRLCQKLGIIHPLNLFELAGKYMEAANFEDITARRVYINTQEEE
jgi:hypothetical protein